MRQKIFYEKDNAANSWRSNYVAKAHVGWINITTIQLFFDTENIRLNWKLDSTVTDHCDTTLINNEPLKIYVHPT